MTKIVINKCYGGFGLSDEANCALAARKGITLYEHSKLIGNMTQFIVMPREEYDRLELECEKTRDYSVIDNAFWNPEEWGRDHPDLVAVVEELGVAASGAFADLKVVEIPDGVEWQLEEYDGTEWIAEKHRTWG